MPRGSRWRCSGLEPALFFPRINQTHAAAFEIGGVACGKNCAARVGNGGDLGVEIGNWTALCPAPDYDLRKRSGSILVERQYPPKEVFCKCRFSLGEHLVATLSSRKKFDPE